MPLSLDNGRVFLSFFKIKNRFLLDWGVGIDTVYFPGI